jgi:hypothetical protein
MYLKKLKCFWMGQVEEKIKIKLFSEIFADSFKVYEFIENRFELTHEEQEVNMQIQINGVEKTLKKSVIFS